MELQRIVGRERYIQATAKKQGEGVSLVVQEQGIITERRDCDANLRQVVQVLQRRRFCQIDA